MKCPRDQPLSPERRLIRTAPRGSEVFDELKRDCTNSSSAHADRAPAREQQIQSLKERVQQQTRVIVNVLVETNRQIPTIQNVEKQLRTQRSCTPKRSWMCQSCANAKNQSSRPPRRQSEFLRSSHQLQCGLRICVLMEVRRAWRLQPLDDCSWTVLTQPLWSRESR